MQYQAKLVRKTNNSQQPREMTIVREADSLTEARSIFHQRFGHAYWIRNVVNYMSPPPAIEVEKLIQGDRFIYKDELYVVGRSNGEHVETWLIAFDLNGKFERVPEAHLWLARGTKVLHTTSKTFRALAQQLIEKYCTHPRGWESVGT